MVFTVQKNGIKKRYCPVTGETLTVSINKGIIIVDSNTPHSIFEKNLVNKT